MILQYISYLYYELSTVLYCTVVGVHGSRFRLVHTLASTVSTSTGTTVFTP